jgi:predicted porin
MNGFQLGASYQPDGANEAGASTRQADNDAGGQHTLLAVGANYSSSFDAADIGVSVGYINGELEGDNAAATAKGFEGFSSGIKVSMSGFTVGGMLSINNGGADNSGEAGWEIGASYGSGPWTIGVNYLDIEQHDATGIGADDVAAWAVTGQYVLGPGVNLWGGVKHYNFDDGVNAAGSENSVLIGALGTSIWF